MTLPPRYYHGLQAYQESLGARPEPIEFVGTFEGNGDTLCVCPFKKSHKNIPKSRLSHHVASKCTFRPDFPYFCRYNTCHRFRSKEGQLRHEPLCIDNAGPAIQWASFSLLLDPVVPVWIVLLDRPSAAVVPRTTPWVPTSTWTVLDRPSAAEVPRTTPWVPTSTWTVLK
jgi:hypothetical protein